MQFKNANSKEIKRCLRRPMKTSSKKKTKNRTSNIIGESVIPGIKQDLVTEPRRRNNSRLLETNGGDG